MLQKAEYTGENRCWPCTVGNLFIIALVSVGISYSGFTITAVVIGLIGVLAVWIRGYAVPGTPYLTSYFPVSVLRFFGTEQTTAFAPADLVQALRNEGLLTDSNDGSLTLTEKSRSRYENRARELVSNQDNLKDAVVGAFPSVTSVSVNRGLGGTEMWFAKDDGESTLIRWDARPLVAMDIAGVELGRSEVAGWSRYDHRKQQQALAVFRQDANTCPACGDEFEVGEYRDVVCCGGRSLTGSSRCSVCDYVVVDPNDLPGGMSNELIDERRTMIQ